MSRIFPGRRCLAAALAASACALAAPAIASAATAGVTGGVLAYNAAPGEANHLTVTFSNGKFILNDTGVTTLTAGAGCVLDTNPRTVDCPYYPGISSMSVDLGDQNDYFNSTYVGLPATVHGGTGDDQIYTGAGNDHLYGDAGNDTLGAGWGSNTTDGGPGTNTISSWGTDAVNVVNSEVDHVTCYNGSSSTVQADSIDVVTGCKSVQTASSGGASTTGTTTTTDPGSTGTSGSTAGYGTTVIPPPVVQFAPAPAVMTANGNVALKLTCPAQIFDGCEGTITLQIYTGSGSKNRVSASRRRKLTKLATRHFKMSGGQSQNLVVHMARRGRRAFERNPRQKVIATVTMNTPSGPTTVVSKITIKQSDRNAPGAHGRHR
jgi:hypothetical protein